MAVNGATAAAAQPRRLPRDARRQQLIAAALPLAARQGLARLSLEDLAVRAGVTRNLLYHYFPRGREDVVLAVVQEAEHQLARSEEAEHQLARSQAFPTGVLDHALAPTHAWRIHRLAAGATDPAIRALLARVAQDRVQTLARTHLSTAQPEPVADAALRGYLGFAEAALDCGRAAGLPRAVLTRLLERVLEATLDVARS